MIFMFSVQIIPFHLEKLEKFIAGRKNIAASVHEGCRTSMRIVTSKETTRFYTLYITLFYTQETLYLSILFPSFAFKNTCLQLPQNVLSIDEMTHVISASTGVNWIRLILAPPYFLDKHDDLFFFFYYSFWKKTLEGNMKGTLRLIEMMITQAVFLRCLNNFSVYFLVAKTSKITLAVEGLAIGAVSLSSSMAPTCGSTQ